MKPGPRNLVLTHHEQGTVRIALAHAGRLADMGEVQPRHRRMLWAAVGATGAGACVLVRVSGRESSWSPLPAAGDVLVGRVVAASRHAGVGDWLRMRVVGAAWWDFGATLEILVRVVEQQTTTKAQRAQRGTHEGNRAVSRPPPGAPARRGRTDGSARGPLSRARPALVPLCALCAFVVQLSPAFAGAGGVAMAENAGDGGTYAELPIGEMNDWLRQTAGRFGEEAVREDLPLAAEAVLSEAQVRSPVLTGFLQNSHVVLDNRAEQDGTMVIGVNTQYALAVHETHKSKKRWFTGAIVEHFPRVLRRLLEKRARERGAQ